MTGLRSCTLLTLLILKVVLGEDHEGQQIANKLGDDLSFASKQVIRGFTSIFGPILDTLHGSSNSVGDGRDDAMHNFRRVILRDGINAVGKGAKAGATILSVPARVAGTGIEEVRKVGQAGMASSGLDSRMGLPPVGDTRSIEDGTKIASTLLNTTSSELSQANLGAVMVEIALKNRIKDIGNRTTSYVQSMRGQQTAVVDSKPTDDAEIKKREGEITTKAPVDQLIERFNEAIKQNDERMLAALKVVLSQINPPKN